MLVWSWTSIIVALASLILFVVFSMVVTTEQKRGQRFWLSKERNKIDLFLEKTTVWLVNWYIGLTRHKLKLSWYYSLHTILVSVLTFLGNLYIKIEEMVNANRHRVKMLKQEKSQSEESHLMAIAKHKQTVKLSTKEQTKRKNNSLRGD